MTAKPRRKPNRGAKKQEQAKSLALVAERVHEALDPALEVPTEDQRAAIAAMREKIEEFLKPHPGRPQIPLNEEQVEKLAAFFLTAQEIAVFFNVSDKTVSDNYSDAIKRGEAYGRASLKRRQFMRAMEGSDTQLIWLGKQHLEQTDKTDHTTGGKPMEAREPSVYIIAGMRIEV